jgi:hypothetical protein
MDVSVWWVLAGTAIGLCAGVVLFAVLTMAHDQEAEVWSDVQAPTRT